MRQNRWLGVGKLTERDGAYSLLVESLDLRFDPQRIEAIRAALRAQKANTKRLLFLANSEHLVPALYASLAVKNLIKDLSAHTWLLMRFDEVEMNGGLQWLIKKDASRHC